MLVPMSDIKYALDQLKEGLDMMRRHKVEEHERWLSMLARWETRLYFAGDDWTWRDFEDSSAARARLEAEGLSTKALRARCKALLRRDEASRSALIREIEHGPGAGLADRIKVLVAQGADPNEASLLKDVPLAFARDRGLTPIFDLLLELGADPAKIGFDALHQAIRFGTLEDVQKAVKADDPLKAKREMDAPLALAVTEGEAKVVEILLDEVQSQGQIKHKMVDTCLGMAVQEGRTDLVRLFLERGADTHTTLEDLTYRYDAEMLALYVEHGADVTQMGDLVLYHDDPLTQQDPVGKPKIRPFIDQLLAAGWRVEHLEEFEHAQIRFVTRAYDIPAQDRRTPGFAEGADTTTGAANPQEVTSAFHLEMARTGVSSFAARKEWGVDVPYGAWTADRFGQSTTRLPDGRWVQIAGEHEDAYDPDFVIFSDVTIHDGQGGMRVFFYPADIFPPTDFHTATLSDNAIWIIGNTGYMGARQVGETPVFRLDLGDMSIRRVEVAGTPPGWISRHEARLEDGLIMLSGGCIFDGQSFVENPKVFLFDPATQSWK